MEILIIALVAIAAVVGFIVLKRRASDPVNVEPGNPGGPGGPGGGGRGDTKEY